MRTTLPLLLLLSLLVLSGCRPTPSEETPKWEEIDPGALRPITMAQMNGLIRSCDPDRVVLREPAPTVFEFYFPACPHCVRLKPLMARLSQEYSAVPIYIVNVRESQEVAAFVKEHLGVTHVPTLLFIHRDGSYEPILPSQKWGKDDDAVMKGLRDEMTTMLESYR